MICYFSFLSPSMIYLNFFLLLTYEVHCCVGIVFSLGFLMVHMPFLNITENPALLSLLMDSRVNAMSGACIAPLKIVLAF